MTTVLITGAAGSLGKSLAPLLAEQGLRLRLFDARPTEASPAAAEIVIGYIRDRDAVQGAVDGVDAIVHAAALHGIHVSLRPPTDFWDVNVTGTFNVYAAARESGVAKVVLASTMGVYGRAAARSEDAADLVTEESSIRPGDIYGISKHLCETLAADAVRAWGITTVALRLGMFVPETFERYGFRLLFGGVDDRDVAQAAALALDHRPESGFAAFNVFAEVPFRLADVARFAKDPGAVIDEHWPGTTALARDRGLDLDALVWGLPIWSAPRAREVLGFRPQYDFGRFVEAWRNDRRDLYPFADQPRWGI